MVSAALRARVCARKISGLRRARGESMQEWASRSFWGGTEHEFVEHILETGEVIPEMMAGICVFVCLILYTKGPFSMIQDPSVLRVSIWRHVCDTSTTELRVCPTLWWIAPLVCVALALPLVLKLAYIQSRHKADCRP